MTVKPLLVDGEQVKGFGGEHMLVLHPFIEENADVIHEKGHTSACLRRTGYIGVLRGGDIKYGFEDLLFERKFCDCYTC